VFTSAQDWGRPYALEARPTGGRVSLSRQARFREGERMNELVTVTADWFRGVWDDADLAGDEDPRDHLHEYIVDPEPLPDDLYDEGGCD
jgi:hypothetical protein